MRRIRHTWRSLAAAMAIAIAAGCATMGHKFEWKDVDALQPGMTVADVEKRLGKPSGTNYLADGSTARTWMWARGTAIGTGDGRSVGILFDSEGRLVRIVNRGESKIR
jgi:hypothetical protein